MWFYCELGASLNQWLLCLAQGLGDWVWFTMEVSTELLYFLFVESL